MGKVVSICAAALLFVESSALAQANTAVAGWDIFDTDDGCGMHMEYEGPGATNLFFAKNLDGTASMLVTNTGWSARTNQEYEITLSFDETGYDIVAVGAAGNRPGFYFRLNAESGARVSDQIIRSTGLNILMGEIVVDRPQLTGTSAAWPAVQRCLRALQLRREAAQREARRYEGIAPDPFAAAAEVVSPQANRSRIASARNGTNWLSQADYPSAAIRERRSGTVNYRVSVGLDGRVAGCEIVASSGHDDLDQATCQNITRRARFEPALDERGVPIAGEYLGRFEWQFP